MMMRLCFSQRSVMINRFTNALNQAKQELDKYGINQIEQIGAQIMEKGGIKNYI